MLDRTIATAHVDDLDFFKSLEGQYEILERELTGRKLLARKGAAASAPSLPGTSETRRTRSRTPGGFGRGRSPTRGFHSRASDYDEPSGSDTDWSFPGGAYAPRARRGGGGARRRPGPGGGAPIASRSASRSAVRASSSGRGSRRLASTLSDAELLQRIVRRANKHGDLAASLAGPFEQGGHPRGPGGGASLSEEHGGALGRGRGSASASSSSAVLDAIATAVCDAPDALWARRSVEERVLSSLGDNFGAHGPFAGGAGAGGQGGAVARQAALVPELLRATMLFGRVAAGVAEARVAGAAADKASDWDAALAAIA
eukprot:CAMPEP_0206064810 /NCGR_PEP_ID=MMETSP1466-20131121/58918_1 /ASSEMBLY_ACC=CAM_ASM_001126 /TAXON_ID=44452 /ORGANISM="Pavlova gyrans, Strain CCMP608" /LENGTH=314 /DNA_ID=CAMNT_0053440183 /DNA_START=1 /DNA_END=941 /DNA_ORIENTATION=+